MECEVDAFAFDICEQKPQVFFFRLRGIVNEIGDFLFLQQVEDVRAAVHALGFERAFFLGEIEEMDVFEGDVVEIEVAAEFQLDLHEFREPAAEDPAAGDGGGQPAEPAKRAEG